MELKTRQGRLEAVSRVRSAMQKAYQTAVTAYQKQSDAAKTKALAEIRVLHHIKSRIESQACRMGLSKACRESIPGCKGECCIWHFPKNLAAVDFFVSLHYLSSTQQDALDRKLRKCENTRYQCPLLNKDGCFFSFDARPMVCTAAYPCFAKQSYWEYYDEQQKDILRARQMLENIMVCRVPSTGLTENI